APAARRARAARRRARRHPRGRGHARGGPPAGCTMIGSALAPRAPMLLICPACHTPLPHTPPGEVSVACEACALEVDLSRLGTVAGKPRFLPERDRSGGSAGDYQLEA